MICLEKITVILLSPYVPQCTVLHLQLLDQYIWERKLINIDHYCYPSFEEGKFEILS